MEKLSPSVHRSPRYSEETCLGRYEGLHCLRVEIKNTVIEEAPRTTINWKTAKKYLEASEGNGATQRLQKKVWQNVENGIGSS